MSVAYILQGSIFGLTLINVNDVNIADLLDTSVLKSQYFLQSNIYYQG